LASIIATALARFLRQPAHAAFIGAVGRAREPPAAAPAIRVPCPRPWCRVKAAGWRFAGPSCPGFEEDQLFEAWNAWLKSCERPGPVFAPLCGEVRRLSIASPDEQRNWMVSRLQPYRVESLQGAADGLLTSYYEPVLKASRQPGAGYEVPLYRPRPRWAAASPGFRGRKSTPRPRPGRRCAAARSPGWPTRSRRCRCTSRARAG
jgi:membrane-bound lytic murein transglycosylase A